VKTTTLNPFYLFISPPHLAALRERLLGRGTESETSIERRLAMAVKEIEYASQSGTYNFVIVNDDLDRAYEIFKKIALGEQVAGDTLPRFDF
jgi:guanylate kinase